MYWNYIHTIKTMLMRKLILTSAMAVTALASYAQRYLGMATSNWSALSSIELNPANIADSRTKLSVDLSCFNMTVDNSLGKVDLSRITDAISSGKITDAFTLSGNSTFNILATIEVKGPGFMYSIDDDNTIAISSRFRAFEQFNNFDTKLFQSIMSPPTDGNYSITSSNFNWTTHIWNEFNLSYARVLYKEKEHFIKAGVTVGRAGGIGYLSLKGNRLDGNFNASDATLTANHSDIEFATNIPTNANQLKDGFTNIAGGLFGGGGGGGFRADLGAVYEYRPDHADWEGPRYDASSNKYKVRASIAVTDIGSIKYKNSLQVNGSGNGTITGTDLLTNIVTGNSFSNYLRSRGFYADTPHADTKVHLPTAMVMGADYYVASHFYVNATWITNLANRQNFGNSYYGQLSIIPRWDTKIFTAALPLTYDGINHAIKAGLGLRLGGWFIGTDDVFISYGVNFYTGAFVPIAKKHKKHKGEATAAPAPATATPGSGESK